VLEEYRCKEERWKKEKQHLLKEIQKCKINQKKRNSSGFVTKNKP
jgi:hypothetical protein